MKPLRILFAVFVVIWLISDGVLSLFVDWNWFEAVGHLELFSTRIWTQFTLWAVTFFLVFSFLFINLRYASSVEKINLRKLQQQLVDIEISVTNTNRLLTLLRWLAIVFPAFIFANVVADQWLYCLAFLEPVSFDRKDTLFGLDYLFSSITHDWFICCCLKISERAYSTDRGCTKQRDVLIKAAGAALHPAHCLALLGALIFLLFWY